MSDETVPRYDGPRALAESLSLFARANRPDAPWNREGLRDDSEYRDLGLAAATGGRIGVKHIRALKPMPVTVLGLFQAASWTRYVRSAALDVIKLDYVTTARSKGLKERTVIIKHVVRNALIPVVTLVALQLPSIFGGAIVTEQIFRVPGIGSLLISAILANDTPVIMGPIIVAGTIDVANAIIAESTLSFLGLGFPPDIPTWGRVLYDAKDYLDIAPYWALFPGTLIFLTVLSINYLGDGLRDALDPRRILSR